MAKVRASAPMPSMEYKPPSPRERLEERVKSLVEDALGIAAPAADRAACCREVVAVIDKHTSRKEG